MEPSAAKLVERMKPDLRFSPHSEDADLAVKYRNEIEVVGAESLLVEMFKQLGDATLTRWLVRLAFVWKDFPFPVWQRILRRLSNDPPAVYQFVSFANEFLGLDTIRMINEDPEVDDRGRRFANARFTDGPRPDPAWAAAVLDEIGIDQHHLWIRLAAEGALMNPYLNRVKEPTSET